MNSIDLYILFLCLENFFIFIVHICVSFRIYEIEKRVKTPEKYLFPFYEALHWFTAQRILDTFKGSTLTLLLRGVSVTN